MRSKEREERKGEFYPRIEDYETGIGRDVWRVLLEKEEIGNYAVKMVFRMFLEQGGCSSWERLEEVYGKSADYYRITCEHFGEKVYKELGCCLYQELEGRYEYILFQGKAEKYGEKEIILWKLREELKEALEEMDLPEIVAEKREIRYWWLNVNPNDWSLEDMEVGEEVEWTLFNDNGKKRRIFQNFLEAKKGDLVIGYESSPVRQILALCKVSKENDGDFISFRKVEDLEVPISLKEIKEVEELERMEYFINPQGSLFKMTKKECEVLFQIIKEQNPNIGIIRERGYTKEEFLEDVYLSEEEFNTLCGLVKRKKNIILQGAPGVGKTFLAKRLAFAMMGCIEEHRIMSVQFHPSYSYENFIMGYHPFEGGFGLEYGIFYNFCKRAESHPEESYFFLIDEINRGNLGKIFGELLMLIESDKRGEKLVLSYDKRSFSVPSNLYIIGMMNTADRSLAIMDYALRRRFSFYKMKPAFEREGFVKYQRTLGNRKLDRLIKTIEELNQEIIQDVSLGEGFVLGHSYFCGQKVCTEEWLKEVVEYDLIPVLEEYWFDNENKLREWAENLREAIYD